MNGWKTPYYTEKMDPQETLRPSNRFRVQSYAWFCQDKLWKVKQQNLKISCHDFFLQNTLQYDPVPPVDTESQLSFVGHFSGF